MTEFKPVVTLNLDQSNVPLRESDPGTWTYALGEGGWGATVVCGDCRNWVFVGPPPIGNHTIDDAGKVSPSTGCSQCGWHIFGTLLGWNKNGPVERQVVG